jgi:Ca2+-transporting ATPase
MSEEERQEAIQGACELEVEAVLTLLEVAVDRGLTVGESRRRQTSYGRNELVTGEKRRVWSILLAQFKSLIVGLLGVAAIVAGMTGGAIEALAILVVLLINAAIGFLTEWQAGRALEALRRHARSMARVRRAGREEAIEAAELVPGDIVILNPGDRVPADLRLIEAANLRTEESALTGESTTVTKAIDPVSRRAPLAERHSMVYLGTSVAAGRAVGVVTATGAATELGKIGILVAETTDEETPLRKRLDHLGRQLVYLVLLIGALLVVAGWWRGDNLWVMLETAISLAVAAVPEGLPAVTTLILALGVLRMARARAIVRHLPAVETLGSATVICTDKTGTLTENRMVVREYRLTDGTIIGQTTADREERLAVRRIAEVSVLCNEATRRAEGISGEEWIGDPTETALLEAARRMGIDIEELRREQSKIAEEPFDATTRRMITVHRNGAGWSRVCLKGAPAAVLDLCAFSLDPGAEWSAGEEGGETPLTLELRAQLLGQNESMASEALRVLAVAEKRIPGPVTDLESGYTFLGMIGMLDPPRREAASAIAEAYGAGIRVVMLTGDQLHTARAIAMELGMEEKGRLEAHHAADLHEVSSEELARLVSRVQVFARVSPADKLRIVEALQQAGEVVAVTGDGVNDAPALKRADIGVAMGARGTETAKEAADIVLTDDNFATIIRAVEGGRTIYANILKFVQLMLSENLAEVIFIFLAILLGWPLPLLPLQILWVNLLTDIFPALALALEPSSPDIMKRHPRRNGDSMLSSRFFLLIGWQGAMLATISLALYWWALETHGPGDHARTVALFVLIGSQIGHVFNCRSRTRSVLRGLFRNGYLWLSVLLVMVLQVMAIRVPFLARILQTTPIEGDDLIAILVAVLLPILIVEVVKLLRWRWRGSAEESVD